MLEENHRIWGKGRWGMWKMDIFLNLTKNTTKTNRFLDTKFSQRVKNRKFWVPASSDEGLW